MDYLPIELPHRMHFTDEEMQRRAEDFYSEIRCRHTVREFSNKPVPRGVIESCLKAAGTAPSGANHQPWHFAVIGDPAIKTRIRHAAEQEERQFYGGRAGDEWLSDLRPFGTDSNKPFLEIAPWLIIIFGQRSGVENGKVRKNYYVPESVGIASGFLITALHHAGLATLTHTPNPMSFLNEIVGRPNSEKPYILLVVGHPAENATVPTQAKAKKSLEEISSFH